MNIFVDILTTTYTQTLGYLPSFFSGLGLFIIGAIISLAAQKAVLGLFRIIQVTQVYRLTGKKSYIADEWGIILSELVKWSVLLAFLIPVFDIWQFHRLSSLAASVLFYIPNIISSLFILMLGLLASKKIFEAITANKKIFNKNTRIALAYTAQYLTATFIVLASISQLGIAPELVKILFTGIVFALSLAIGLAFGLGGKKTAQNILEELKKQIQKKK